MLARFNLKRKGSGGKRVCHFCLNVATSVSVALNVRFTTNGICMKTNTHIYVAQTSNNKMILTNWSWWVTSNNACEPGEQLTVLPDGNDEIYLVGWSLLLLVATVWSIVHLLLKLSDCNTRKGLAPMKGHVSCIIKYGLNLQKVHHKTKISHLKGPNIYMTGLS